MTKSFLSKDAILASNDRATKEIDVSEWGGRVIITSLTGEERDAFEQSCVEFKNGKRKDNLTNLRARFVALTLVDDKGKRLFGDSEVKALGRKSAKVLDQLFTVAQELNGMRDADVEELVGNSEEDQSDTSTSS